MAQSFTAQIGGWAQKSKQRLQAVHRASAQALGNEVVVPREAGGNMPVVSGNLRRSLMASTSAMPLMRDGVFTEGDIKAVIVGAELGQTIYLGFQAGYARRMEYGFTGEDSLGRFYDWPGYGFVRLAAQRWPQIVSEQTQIIHRRSDARAAFASLPEQ